jgi:hypothetical protein
MAEYTLNKKVGTNHVETANGIIVMNMFETKSLTALSRTVRGMPIQVYDFLAHGILSDYDGLLGLDFFKNTEIHINLKNNTIEVIQ